VLVADVRGSGARLGRAPADDLDPCERAQVERGDARIQGAAANRYALAYSLISGGSTTR
jgi:hypothetical protein